ncbi:MAG: hypothetical protein A2289_24995 [Deltaproteobacteria bacterium RIFOXYA12_FULL_58_15]|nr:MAG: hypothetical protein A2289_24995 [Deltaproteobacteria bacterium RIFOXYA12_FULL_58_15]OGR11016.1 MAG: hypothetical protein A2341_11565 [Deltaproteobacteria bacterium RIFOXYB12_FULL_58_9]
MQSNELSDLLERAAQHMRADEWDEAQQALTPLEGARATDDSAEDVITGLLLLASLRGAESPDAAWSSLQRAETLGEAHSKCLPPRLRAESALLCAYHFSGIGDDGTARAHLEVAVERARLASDPNLLVTALYLLAGAHAALEDIRGAEPLLRECTEVLRQSSSTLLPQILVERAGLLSRQGAAKAALCLLQSAHTAADEIWDMDDPRLAVLLTGLAIVHMSVPEPDHAAAEEALEGALAIYSETLGDQHPEVGRTLILLGRLNLQNGKPQKAQPLLAEAIWLLQRAEVPDPLTLADAHNNAGSTQLALGDAKIAIEHFNAALAELSKSEEDTEQLARLVRQNLALAAGLT